MSIRFDTSTDTLQRTLTTGLTIGTGQFNKGIWVKLKSDVNARRIVFISGPTDGGSPMLGFENNSTGTAFRSLYTSGNAGDATTDKTVDVWYWVVLSRNGSNSLRLRVFDDSTSTTPLDTKSNGPDNDDYGTAQDEISVGDPGHGLGSADAEVCNFKIHTTTEWTDAECRTESQKFGIQKAGGTDRYCWGLETVDADGYGINEFHASGENLTNSGAVNGASRPSQLEATTSGTTLYILNSTASGANHGQLQVGGSAPSTATTGTGWTVDTVGSSNYSRMAYATERLSSTFSGTAQPSGAPDNTLGDCFRSTNTMTGDFATGVWTITVPVIAVTAASGQDGRVRVRLWKSSNADGSSATEITSGAVTGTTVTDLTTGAEQTSVATTSSITGFSLANEYLFLQVAWEITGAAT